MATSEQWLKMWEEGFHHHHDDQGEHAAAAAPDSREKKHASGPGHHGTEVDKYLRKHLGALVEDKDRPSIFVTLCGNSPDLAWLCEKGYEVVGCELSTKAVEQLFENKVLGGKIDHVIKEEGGTKVFTATDGKKLRVYAGDFFGALSPELAGTFDCVWDCHGIISVPANLHSQYAEKLSTFLKPGGRMLFSTLDCACAEAKVPGPIPVSTARLAELFPGFNVKVLENSDSPWHNKKFGGGSWTNPIALLTRKD